MIRSIWEFVFTPVYLREVRQAVRNRAEAYALCFYLLIMVVICLFAAVTDISMGNTDRVGTEMFRGLFYIAFHGTLVAVVLHTAIQLVSERISDDLMYYSTLSASSFVRGKFVSGVMLSLMFYSATLPFATLAYLFRGIEIIEIFMLLFLSFSLIQVFNLLALACFAGANSIPTAIVRGLVFVALAGLLYFVPFMFYEELMMRGIPRATSWNEWTEIIALGSLFFIILPLMLFFLAVAQFAPKETNRMFGFRITATVILFLGTGICTFFSIFNPFYSYESVLYIWLIVMIYPFSILCVLPMFERDEYGLRLRKNLPQNPLLRLLAFPFYTGACNGMIWTAFWIVLSFFAILITLPFSRGSYLSYDDLCGGFSCVLMTFSYVALTHLLWTVLLRRWVAKDWIWLITLGLLCVGVFFSVPLAMSFDMLYELRLLFVPYVFWAPFGPGSFQENGLQLLVSAVAFLMSCVYLFSLFVIRFEQFKPFDPHENAISLEHYLREKEQKESKDLEPSPEM